MKNTTKDSLGSINEFYKKSKFFYVADIIILMVIIILCCSFYFAFRYNDGDMVEVYYKDKLVYSQNLNVNGEYFFNKHGENLIVIDSQKVYIKNANCKNQICVHHKSISLGGEVIICAPHYLSVKIIGKNSLDGVTG